MGMGSRPRPRAQQCTCKRDTEDVDTGPINTSTHTRVPAHLPLLHGLPCPPQVSSSRWPWVASEALTLLASRILGWHRGMRWATNTHAAQKCQGIHVTLTNHWLELVRFSSLLTPDRQLGGGPFSISPGDAPSNLSSDHTKQGPLGNACFCHHFLLPHLTAVFPHSCSLGLRP